MKTPLWIPDVDLIRNANLSFFMAFVNELFNAGIKNYSELHKWSVENYSSFWFALLKFSGLSFSGNPNNVIENPEMPGAEWFPEIKINYAENLLRFRNDTPAIISVRENIKEVKLTHNELYLAVAKTAFSLKKLGVQKGSVVAAVIPNIPEAVVLMLAVTSIGAIWSSSSPEFGEQALLDRFSQINPDLLILTTDYYYNGKHFFCDEKNTFLINNLITVKKIITVNPNFKFNYSELETFNPELAIIPFCSLLDNSETNIAFEKLDFNSPQFILYSSGTTGLPKCIVHSCGGTLLQHYKELSLHTNLKSSDVIFFYTTCGWMMWNWLISSLMTGAAIFLYDGNPFFPENAILWSKVDEYKISVFGTSPKYLTVCEDSGLIPKNLAELKSLKTILSTGAPLTSRSYKYVYGNIKRNVLLSSISGGTDIISCFMLGNPLLPVYSEEIQCCGLGMDVKAYNESGESIIDQKGELVCAKPFPSMPVKFVNDPENKRYISSYFEKYPGVWHHGDFISITSGGGVIVYGRSDAVLNPKGIRIGTAEIYRIVEYFDSIDDSVCVAYKNNSEDEIYLFVSMKNGKLLDLDLANSIRKRIQLSLSPKHVPDKIIQVPEIPKTYNGKKVEITVSRIINGIEVENTESIANPESLQSFYKIRESLIHRY